MAKSIADIAAELAQPGSALRAEGERESLFAIQLRIAIEWWLSQGADAEEIAQQLMVDATAILVLSGQGHAGAVEALRAFADYLELKLGKAN